MTRSIPTYAGILGSLTPTLALAHPGDHSGMSVAQGVRHLLTEPDHLALFAVVGLLAAAGGWLLRTRVR